MHSPPPANPPKHKCILTAQVLMWLVETLLSFRASAALGARVTRGGAGRTTAGDEKKNEALLDSA